ncbi:beta-lactamase family protein [Qipengyuania sp. SS22]|uniref:serine hydrolase domain-containing protein n=1 Tax=Qipengyuania sp. SS22 TaxID=2979461 RepID=UPI0021E5E722|nr:serine hydrolase domain-containing protein [Qipengyuania sp. SS22]UYH55182.1 beta-lactamase family protein [Qipengyuania sp. SS22]
MTRPFLLLAVLMVAWFPAGDLRATSADWGAVDVLVDAYDKPDEPGISLAVSVDGQTVYHRWAGQADLARGVPIAADTRFQIASVSKQFTAYAIMLLVDEGTIALDKDIRQYLPGMQPRSPVVTVRHLLDHTSGLREANSLLLLTGQSEVAPVSATRSLDLVYRQRGGNFTAGERQEYSNTGYQLLARIVAQVSGMPFAEFVQRRMLEPLGMTHSLVRTEPYAIIAGLAASYDPRGGGFVEQPILATTYGSTGMVSTPLDLVRWGHALNVRSTGSEAAIALLDDRSSLTDGQNLVGANGQEFRRLRGFDTWSHGGSQGGFRSFLLRIPGRRMVIAVMGNRADFQKARFAFDVARALLSLPEETLQVPPFEPETGPALDRYTGDYRLFAGNVFSLQRDGDSLTFATFGKDDAFPVRQIGPGEFMLDPRRDLRLQFTDFEAGRASEMRWVVSEDGFLRAPRVAMQPVPADSLDPADLSGTYYSDELQQVIELSDKDGALWLRMGNGASTPLERYQPDLLRPIEHFAIQRLRIPGEPSGDIASLLVSTALADDIPYRRIDTPPPAPQ